MCVESWEEDVGGLGEVKRGQRWDCYGKIISWTYMKLSKDRLKKF